MTDKQITEWVEENGQRRAAKWTSIEDVVRESSTVNNNVFTTCAEQDKVAELLGGEYLERLQELRNKEDRVVLYEPDMTQTDLDFGLLFNEMEEALRKEERNIQALLFLTKQQPEAK